MIGCMGITSVDIMTLFTLVNNAETSFGGPRVYNQRPNPTEFTRYCPLLLARCPCLFFGFCWECSNGRAPNGPVQRAVVVL